MSCFGLKSKTGIILEVKTKRISGSGLNIKGGKCENGKGLSQTGYICKRLRVFTGVPHTQSAGLKTSTPLNASLVPALPSRTLSQLAGTFWKLEPECRCDGVIPQ